MSAKRLNSELCATFQTAADHPGIKSRPTLKQPEPSPGVKGTKTGGPFQRLNDVLGSRFQR